jgi:predicted O-linked N-acetylglucosamine transferase (SPINDLY family)
MKSRRPNKSDVGAVDTFQQAISHHQRGALAEATRLYQKLIAKNPRHAGALHGLGVIASNQQQTELALKLIGFAISIEPKNFTYHHNEGIAYQATGRLAEAISSYTQALQLNQNSLFSWYNRGVAHLELDNPAQAASDFNEAIRISPTHSQAFFNLGNCHRALGSSNLALEAYDSAILLDPTDRAARANRATTLLDLRAFDRAVEEYGEIIRLSPNADAFCNRGAILQKLGRQTEAIEDFKRAIAVDPNLAEAFSNLGIAYRKLGDHAAALSAYDRAIEIDPSLVEAHCNKGVALKEAGLIEEAILTLKHAASIAPNHPETHGNLGVALQKTKQFKAAFASYLRAIELKADYVDAHYNLAFLYQELNQIESALKGFDQVLRLDPNYEYLDGTRLYTRMRLCDWTNYEAVLARLCDRIQSGQKVSPGFPAVTLIDSPSIQRRVAETWINDKHPRDPRLGPITRRSQDTPQSPGAKSEKVRSAKIRLGYYSADFYNHATSYLMAELFERHNRKEFDLIGFSFGPQASDGMSKRVRQAFTQFIDVRSRTDLEIAQLSRTLEIDIAVDLKGFTQGQRAGIFSYRAAPVQVSYLGYPGTMGADYIDYLIADERLIPFDQQIHYSEKIVYLPNSYQVNDRKRSISSHPLTRQDVGLPAEGFVYCCFNNSYKITPMVLDRWCRILMAVEGSILWLLQDNEKAAENLRLEAVNRGLDPDRLIFAPRMDLADHLARHRLADLFLDTLPCNAHTTASDALWAGLPVLTLPGQTFAGRVAASLLTAVGLRELIAKSIEDYESIAIQLGQDQHALSTLKCKLHNNRQTEALFDTDCYTEKLESAFREMHRRSILGQQPTHLIVQP